MHNSKTKFIRCYNSDSYYKIESNGKIRFIEMPNNRCLLIGQLSTDESVLLLFKNRANYKPKSYTLGIPTELLDNLKNIEAIAVNVRQSDHLLCVRQYTVRMFGYQDDSECVYSHSRQLYTFLDAVYWDRVDSLKDVFNISNHQMKFGRSYAMVANR